MPLTCGFYLKLLVYQASGTMFQGTKVLTA